MLRQLHACLWAFSLLTTLPLPKAWMKNLDASTYSLSPVYYGWVGALLSALLTVFVMVTSVFSLSTAFLAALLVAVWVGLTGAMHIDGLADTIDACYAAHRQPERLLKVMSDPTCGPMGVVSIVLVLLLKWAALDSLLSHESHSHVVGAIALALIFARVSVIWVIRHLAYIREQGIASGLQLTEFSRIQVYAASALLLLGLIAWLPLGLIVTTVLSSVLSLWLWKRFWHKKIGGYTGDVLGAQIEWIECLVLTINVFYWA